MNPAVTRAGRVEAAPFDRELVAQLVAQLGYDPLTSTAVLVTQDAVRVATLVEGRATTYVHPVVDTEAATA